MTISYFLNKYVTPLATHIENNVRHYIIIRRQQHKPKKARINSHELPHKSIPKQLKLLSNQFIPLKKGDGILINGERHFHLNKHNTVQTQSPYIDEIYHMKVPFADSMYRVIIHDNGLNVIYTPAKLLSIAIPAVQYIAALKIIDYASKNKTAIVATVPLDDALLYVKSLKRYSFTASMEEA